jgi:hypothetical protein
VDVAQLSPAALAAGSPMPAPLTVETDAQGRFTVAGVHPGLYLFKVDSVASTPDRDGMLAAMKELSVPEDSDSLELTIEARRGWSVRGRALDPDGKPARAAIQVTSVESGSLPFLSRESDESGRFALGPFETESVYELVAVSLDGRLAPSERVAVDARRREPTLKLRAGGSLALKAVRVDDSSVASATFELAETSNAGIANAPAPLTSTDGHFRSIAPGHYDAIATTDDGWVGYLRDVTIRDGDPLAEKTVTLNRGATVKFRHDGHSSDHYVARFWLGDWCFRTATLQGQHEYEFLVPARTVRVQVTTDGKPFEKEVELAAGETRELSDARDQ